MANQRLKFSRFKRWYDFLMDIRKKPLVMISIENFASASFEKKCDVVTGYSNYITMRKVGDCKVYLYHTGIFFIEVHYSPTYQKVLMIYPFNDSVSLEPYAEMISLADLNL